MNKFRFLKIIPILLLLIIIGIFVFQLKSKVNTNVMKVMCITSMCVDNSNGMECIYLKSKLSYLDINSNTIILTQTPTDCRE